MKESVDFDESRFAPPGICTQIVKVQAKWMEKKKKSEHWGYWPALAFFRAPGTESGQENLKEEDNFLLEYPDFIELKNQ